ncbi:hypothetical protein FRB99_007187 [Tulasnella sp. 403]|nr:hypothetical protein FRB99_007187 [Tulasnella sp. 403]
MSKEDTRRSGDSRSSGGLSPPKLEGPGRRSSDEIASSPSLPGSSQQAPLRGTPTDSPPAGSSRRPSAEQEQCEDWNKTRAAKRVSLALLPSDRKLSALSLLGRYSIKSMTEEIDGDERGVGTSRTLT